MSSAIRVRRGRIGDLGWMIHRQAVVYAKEFGYSQVFETYLHEGAAVFLRKFDAKRDRIWIAESNEPQISQISQKRFVLRGSAQSTVSSRRVVGFVAIQNDPDHPGWAKLRWFLVEREARGKGIGMRLMNAALAFGRRAGYRGVLLWTVDDLAGARALYERAGFTLAWQDADPCAWAPWGHEQRWERALPPT